VNEYCAPSQSTFADDSGGIFRRRLELSVVEDIRGVDAKVFAVLGSFAPDADRRLADIEATRVPNVHLRRA
jgi:hypothetical protein